MLPIRRFVFDSTLPPSEFRRHLSELKGERDYSGNVWQGGFSISERLGHVNELYRPWVRGSVLPASDGGSRVTAVISPHPVEVILTAVVPVLCVLSSRPGWFGAIFGLCVLFILHVVLWLLVFAPAATRAEDLLRASGTAG